MPNIFLVVFYLHELNPILGPCQNTSLDVSSLAFILNPARPYLPIFPPHAPQPYCFLARSGRQVVVCRKFPTSPEYLGCLLLSDLSAAALCIWTYLRHRYKRAQYLGAAVAPLRCGKRTTHDSTVLCTYLHILGSPSSLHTIALFHTTQAYDTAAAAASFSHHAER